MTVKGIPNKAALLMAAEENDNANIPLPSGVISLPSQPVSHQQHTPQAQHQRKQNGKKPQQSSEEQLNHKYQQHVPANNIHEKSDRVSSLV